MKKWIAMVVWRVQRRSHTTEKEKGDMKEQMLADKHPCQNMYYLFSFCNHNYFFCPTVFILPWMFMGQWNSTPAHLRGLEPLSFSGNNR